MKLKKFVDKLKKCKKTSVHTGFFNCKMKSSNEKNVKFVYRTDKCSKCKKKEFQLIQVRLFENCDLTIFQTEMLFALFRLNKKPFDYANYHKCIAGKKFIKNIESINVWH